uniref:G_PROTEIN_RECEP_F1_2 domain-containing protein n=1 Tax=Steinernema glaseri TaxID=37863 RepID=A0A1I8AC26_9BILA
MNSSSSEALLLEDDPSILWSEEMVGIIYLVLSVFILIFNLIIQFKMLLKINKALSRAYNTIQVISRHHDLNAPAYRIMLHLGICCWLQVFVHAFGGIFAIAHSTFHPWLVKVLGGVLNSAWVASIAFTLLLAFNRFVFVCLPLKAKIYFSRAKLSAMIFALWLWPFGLFFAAYLTPFTSMHFFVHEFRWAHDGAPWSPIAEDCEVFSIILMILLCAVCYVPVFYKLIMMNKRLFAGRAASISERRVLFQGMSIFGYNFLLMFAFGAHKFLFHETRWTFFGVNVLWILNAAINPVLYLVFNRTVRKPFVQLLLCRCPEANKVCVVAVSSTRTNQTVAPT